MKLLLALLCLASLVPAAPVTVPAPATLQVICYHRFKPACGKDPYCVSDKDLGAQLDWLKAQGWKSVGLTQVARALDGGAALPPKSVMLSVDDGYKAGARGAAFFEARGFHGVFFVNPASLAEGTRGAKSAFLRPADLRALEARGHDIGSHSLTHYNLAKVPKGKDPAAYTAWLEPELGGARRKLQDILGHPVTDLAWPFGAYNEALIAAARAAGYQQLYTVTEASALVPGADRLRLPRLLLTGPVPLASFERRFAQRDAPSHLGGLRDGEVLYRDELPRLLAGNAGGLVLDGDALKGGLLKAQTRDGFHFLSAPGSGGARPQRILFQVAPRAWETHFRSLQPQPQP